MAQRVVGHRFTIAWCEEQFTIRDVIDIRMFGSVVQIKTVKTNPLWFECPIMRRQFNPRRGLLKVLNKFLNGEELVDIAVSYNKDGYLYSLAAFTERWATRGTGALCPEEEDPHWKPQSVRQ